MPYIGKQPANVPVTADDIPANSIDASKIIDGAITIADIADDAVTADKLANSINSAIAANTAKVTNSTSASDLSSGTLPMARLSGTLPALNGSALTSVNAVNGGRKNMIINGAMQVAQRGTSFNAGSSGIYTLDRFKAENDAVSMTVSQDTDSPVGFSSSLKCLNGSGTASSGSDSCYIRQYFEGYNTSHLEIGTANAKEVTLSFWVKSSITGTYIVSFLNAGQDDGYATSYTISLANTWEYKTVTLTFSDYASWSGSTTNSSNFILHFDLGSGSDRDFTSLNVWNDNVNNKWTHSSQVDWVATTGATFYLTGVQLELGSVATDFEHRSYGEELALCQRYYYLLAQGAWQQVDLGGYRTSSFMNLFVNFPTCMRVSPSLVATSGTNYYMFETAGDDYFDAFTLASSYLTYARLVNSTQVSGSGVGAVMTGANSAARIAFDAEI